MINKQRKEVGHRVVHSLNEAMKIHVYFVFIKATTTQQPHNKVINSKNKM